MRDRQFPHVYPASAVANLSLEIHFLHAEGDCRSEPNFKNIFDTSYVRMVPEYEHRL
jgi:hypothetical protein